MSFVTLEILSCFKMEAHDTSTSDTSNSEGEYVLSQAGQESSPLNSSWPKFDCSMWNPDLSSGLSFISLLPFPDVPYKLPDIKEQTPAPGKMKVSMTHRKARRKEFCSGKTTGRDIVDAKRLRHAVSSNDYKLAEDLLESGADPCSCDDKKRTPLHIAATKGNGQMINLLLDKGAEVNQADIIGNTPLHLAACTNNIQVVTTLLRAGTDVNALDNSGSTPLHLAKSRLRILQDSKCSSDQLKTEAMHIVDMMKEYLSRTGCHDNLAELEVLCGRLQGVSTRQDIDNVNSLLSDFANLQLDKRHQPR